MFYCFTIIHLLYIILTDNKEFDVTQVQYWMFKLYIGRYGIVERVNYEMRGGGGRGGEHGYKDDDKIVYKVTKLQSRPHI